MTQHSTSETTTHLHALAIDNVVPDPQQVKAELMTDPENQGDSQLAALRLAEQDRIRIQNNTALLSNEHYEELDGITEG